MESVTKAYFVSEDIISKGIKCSNGYKEAIVSPLILLRLETTTFVFLELTIKEIALDSKHLPSGILCFLTVICNALGSLKVKCVIYLGLSTCLPFIYLPTSKRKNESK